MTLSDIKAMTCDFITPDIVAKVAKQNAQQIRMTAKEDRDALGYPVSVSGTRTRIPRKAFINWVEGKSELEGDALQILIAIYGQMGMLVELMSDLVSKMGQQPDE